MDTTQHIYIERIYKSRSFIMGVAMLTIMLFHQRFIGSNEYLFMMPFIKFGHWGVDIFFFLSGIGIVFSLAKYDLKTFCKRRLLRLIPSCLLFGIVKSVWIFFIQGKSITFFSFLSFDLWFIRALILFYIISPLLFLTLNKNTAYTSITSLIASAILAMLNFYIIKSIFSINNIYSLPFTLFVWPLWRLPVYVTGMVIATNGLRWLISFPRRMYSIGIICILGEFTFAFGASTYSWSNVLGLKSIITYYLLILAIPAMIDMLVRINLSIPAFLQKLITNIGILSLELYLVHEFIFKNLVSNFGTGWIQFIIAFLLSFITAYILKYFSAKITPVFSK